VFRNLLGAAEGALIRAAASTQTLGAALNKPRRRWNDENIFSILVVITFVAASVAAQSNRKAISPAQKVERELIELERQLSEALVRQDASVLDRLWSETLVFTFPDGHISNKAQRLAAQKPSADPNQLTNRNEEVKVYPYGNSAVVTVRSKWVDKAGTQPYGNPYQATHVWVKQHGRWQLVAAHVSQVKT
jgi:hypothetical protein